MRAQIGAPLLKDPENSLTLPRKAGELDLTVELEEGLKL